LLFRTQTFVLGCGTGLPGMLNVIAMPPEWRPCQASGAITTGGVVAPSRVRLARASRWTLRVITNAGGAIENRRNTGYALRYFFSNCSYVIASPLPPTPVAMNDPRDTRMDFTPFNFLRPVNSRYLIVDHPLP
jgi:hypothetical protein